MAQEVNPVAVKVLAWLHILLAGCGLAVGGWFCASIWLIRGRFSEAVLAFAFPVYLTFAMLLFLPQLACGIGLLRGYRWAAVMILLLSALLMPIFPFGTVLGGFAFWVLLGGRARAWARGD